jgi:hypothetical protein
MAVEPETVTVYQIRPRHRPDEVQEVMPADEPGVMVTDRGPSDEARAWDNVRQHKGWAPIPRSIRETLATKTGRARDFGEGLKALRQDAVPRWHASRQGPVPDGPTAAKALQEALTYQRRDRRLKDRDHHQRLTESGWHHDRGNLVRCLADPRIEPTNNRAERARRPAVLARNVSPGSKTGAGAHAFEAFTSVVRTLVKQGTDSLVEGLSHLCRSPSIPDVPP